MNQKMNSKAQKKIRRLKKIRIWPSIFFFLVSFLVTGISIAIFVSLFMFYIFQAKFDSALQNTNYIGTMIETNLLKGETYHQSFQFLMNSAYSSNSVAILDQNNELLAYYGNPSYDLEKQGRVDVWSDYDFYQDKNGSGNLFNPQGDLYLNMGDLFTSTFHGMGKGMKDWNGWLGESLYEEPYWLLVTKNPCEEQILVRNTFQLFRKDVIFIFGMGIGVLAVMFLPLLFLLIHVLSNMTTQRRMYLLLNTDLVTGGSNWFYFVNHAEKKLKHIWNADKTYAMIHISYPKYRSFCSCHSTKEEELLLQNLCLFYEKQLQKGELYAHLNEADFVFLLNGKDRQDIQNRLMSWFESIPQAVPVCHGTFQAGICMIEPVDKALKRDPAYRRSPDVLKLFHNAGIAKDSLSEADDKSIQFFDEAMLKQQIWEHHVEERMEQALQSEEFQVYLQPKYDPVTETLAGAEALVRWINEEDGFVPPGRFIPILEKNGFITRLDDYMISHVAALQAKWLKEGRKVVPVSVNVSRVHFAQADLAEHICKLVDVYELPHELLEIELTESAFFDDKESLLHTVHALKEYGFDISMDDFGAGYSSLNSLKELPLDVLKLDAEFFRGEFEKERGEIVVSEAIHMAKNLNMRIVAEGIEEKNQVDFLANIGCDMIQGYYFAKPMPSTEYEEQL